MINSRFLRTKRYLPCPVCEGVSGACRIQDELIFCHTFIDGIDHPLFSYAREAKGQGEGVWGIYYPRKEKTFDPEWMRRKLEHQAKRQAILEQQAEAFANGLTREERDQNIRRLSKTIGLATRHRIALHERGLNDAQIAESLFFSISPGMELPSGISDKFPGVKEGRLCTSKSGYACVAFDHHGLAIGFQIRDESAEAGNKYTWARGTFPSHLQTGELPITTIGEGETAFLCEGLLKPRVAHYKVNGWFIGASSGHFPGAPLQTKAILGKCRNIVLCPDGGDVLNRNKVRAWERTQEMFNWNYRVYVAWWEQYTKSDPDIDEIANWDEVKFLTLKEWEQVKSQVW